MIACKSWAEGRPAQLWNPEGSLRETEIHFVAPEDTTPGKRTGKSFPAAR